MDGNAPTGLFCLSSGDLCMGFKCTGSELPWTLVRVAVRAMLEATRQGFAAQYRIEWRHPGIGIAMHVALIIVDGAMARVLTGGRVELSNQQMPSR